MIQDPLSLLERAPELVPLCDDTKIRRAIEQGNPFKLYRALFWARLGGRHKPHRETLRTLLANRRLFALPLKRMPWLATVNSFGGGFVGSAESDLQDGTYITTHAVVALFKVPLFPLGAYVVRPGDGRTWQIFARVPLGPIAWLWSRGLALGTLALIALGAYGAFHSSRFQPVQVLNGFSQSLVATVGNRHVTVPANSHVVLEDVPVGRQQARATTAKGVEVEVLELTISSKPAFIAWNIAGAAPLYQATVEYWQHPPSPEPPPAEPKFYCGQRLVELGKIDDLFREPPKTVSMSKDETRVSRSVVGVLSNPAGGAAVCGSVLRQENQGLAAAPLLTAQLRLSNFAANDVSMAIYALAANPKEALRLASLARETHADSLEAHRNYQLAADLADEFARVREEYRRRAEAAPDSADAQYLYTRLLRGSQSQAAIEKLIARFPDHPFILRSAIYDRSIAGRWKELDQAWTHLQKKSAKDAVPVLEYEVSALVALDRGADAERLLKELFASPDEATRELVAELYVHVARLMKLPAPDGLIAELEKSVGEKLWALRARSGLPTQGAKPSPLIDLLNVLHRDPAQAVALSAALSPNEVAGLSSVAWALAYCEAVRTQQNAAQKTLERSARFDHDGHETLLRFVRGEAVSLDDTSAPFDVRAAARIVRARNRSLSAEEREGLIKAALAGDPLHGLLAEAAATWKG